MTNYNESYAIGLNGIWSLEDLYVFPRTFEQVYFLTYSLTPDISEHDRARFKHAYAIFPWQGGYSAVSFYNQLKYAVPSTARPRVLLIEYSSPGILALGLITTVALGVAHLVTIVAGSIKTANHTYTEVVRGLQKRKLMRLDSELAELKLMKAEMAFIDESAATIANVLGITALDAINGRTGHPYRTLKILLSLYRRVRTLAEYQNRGKAYFSTARKPLSAANKAPLAKTSKKQTKRTKLTKRTTRTKPRTVR